MPDQLSLEHCLDRGVAWFNRGRSSRAAELFSEAIEAAPRDPRGWYFRALARCAAGRRAAAEKDVAVMVRLEPRSSRIWLQAADLLRKAGRPDKARKAFEKAAETAPPDSRKDVFLARARFELESGAAGAARVFVRKAFPGRPDPGADELPRALGLEAAPEPAAPATKKAAPRRSKVEGLLDEGVRLFNAGRAGRAASVFSKAVAAAPRDSRGYYFRALARSAGGRTAEAERDVAGMTKLQPKAPRVWLQAAEAYKELRLPEKARAALRQALRSADPASRSEVLLASARLEWVLGSSSAARKGVERVLGAHGKDAVVCLRSAQLLEELGEYGPAEALFSRAAASDPVSTEPALELARLRLWRGRTAEAARLAGRVLSDRPQEPAALGIVAAAAAMGGDFPDAERRLEEAAAASPSNPEPLVWRAEVRRRKGDVRGAFADLERAEALAPNHLAAFLNLELLNLGAGRETPFAKRFYVCSRVPVEVAPLKKAFETGAGQARAALLRALRALGGNRTAAATFVLGRGPEARLADHVRWFPRDRLVNLQAALRFCEPEAVLSSFAEIVGGAPREAYPYSHRGEVFLWLGRWEAARGDFENALRLNDALLWPKVGVGAVRLFQGRLDGALSQFDYALGHGGSASIVCPWRGETLRRLGRFAEARREFERVPDPMPFRPSVWISRALTSLALGDRTGMRRIHRDLRRHAPEFFADVGEGGGPKAVLERGLKLLRGNRSRWMYTYVAPDGRFKVIRFRGVDPSTIPPGQEGNRWQFYEAD